MIHLLNIPPPVNYNIHDLYHATLQWVLDTGIRVAFATIIFFTGIWAIKRYRRRISSWIFRRRLHSTLKSFFESLLVLVLYLLLVYLTIEILGIHLTVFAAVIAAFGAAAGLALSGTLQNFASGVLIILLKPFVVGDDISAQGIEGTVSSIEIFFTIITTYDNRTVIMPNSKLSNEVIVNITNKGLRRLDIELKFSYKEDVTQIKELLLRELTALPEVNKVQPPQVGISLIQQDGYNILINIWINAHGFERARMKINEHIIDKLHAAGIYLAAS
jgi:small conductance mechanosensitive channel